MKEPTYSVSVGQSFGKWIVLEKVRNPKRRGWLWRCICECGSIRLIRGDTLAKHHSSHCLNCKLNPSKPKHGHTSGSGWSLTYGSWMQMRQRCTNPKAKHFDRYGGRGIRVCDAWNDFRVFLADMGERPSKGHSIDRINGDGNYEPGNCRWATRREQQNNLKNNVLITHDGKTLSISAWSRETGISINNLRYRINHGWPVAEALSRRPDPHNKRLRKIIPN